MNAIKKWFFRFKGSTLARRWQGFTFVPQNVRSYAEGRVVDGEVKSCEEWDIPLTKHFGGYIILSKSISHLSFATSLDWTWKFTTNCSAATEDRCLTPVLRGPLHSLWFWIYHSFTVYFTLCNSTCPSHLAVTVFSLLDFKMSFLGDAVIIDDDDEDVILLGILFPKKANSLMCS